MKIFGLSACLLCLLTQHCQAKAKTRGRERTREGGEFNEETDIFLCASKASCDSCLEAKSSCAWCSDWRYSNRTLGKPRCNTADRLEAFGCPADEIRAAQPSSVEFLENINFQDVTVEQSPVQLKPQKIRVKLRPDKKEVVTVQYRPAKNYPLDLYYMMDLTWSMRDDKDTLVGLGRKMASTLGTFTTNFRLGFGSYADKPLMPYVFPEHADNPCKAEMKTCAPLYSFRHRMELTNDIRRFVVQVRNSEVTGNVDNLEGGLDGVVQAIVCEEQVGWVRQARKLMLVATDGLMHFAGEGKLGGVVDRNDLHCHLDEDGHYTQATRLDYPSLAEVSRLLRDNKVNLIFAVTEDRRAEYEIIAGLLKEKARVATLASNSSNILEIIESAYHDILTRVVLRDNSTEPLRLRYFSNCGHNSESVETRECNGIQEGEIYSFDVELSFDECPKNESLWRQTVVVDDALASEASETTIQVELICGCDCKNRESSQCKHGVDDCGSCTCDYGWTGETCECHESSTTENQLQCIEEGSSDVCSRRGECICGSCVCDPGYNGKFCECLACDKTDGVECGGRGSCDCGVCKCLPGWKGGGCQCPSGNEACIAPGSTEVCANHGYCDCGHCRCNVTSATDGLLYRGTYCESSASVGGIGLCILYNSCVNATSRESPEAEQICRSNTTLYKIERPPTIDTASDHYCILKWFKDNTVCTIPYEYEFHEDLSVTLKIAEKACYTPMHKAVLPGMIVLAVFAMGIIALLVWKGYTTIQDRREYAKFEQERKKTIYALDENPIFRPAVTRFRVPSMYKED